MKIASFRRFVMVGGLVAGLLPSAAFAADDARDILKAMSDFMAEQKTFSFSYQSAVEVVTPEFEKLQFVSSGNVAVERPDKIKVTRTGGFADLELVFDGDTLSVLGKNLNAYAQMEAKGTLADLGEKFESAGIEPPGADLLSPNIYELLIDSDAEARHVSSAYIDGVECEYLAVRTHDVDWQIWVQAGDKPLPLRYVITSKHVSQAPQYSVQTSNWKLGADASSDFSFDKPADARKVDLGEMKHLDEIPDETDTGDAQ
jgi:hypothetical protein